MSKPPPSTSAARLLKARKMASRQLKLPVTDWRVRRMALLQIVHDNITARLAAGSDVSVDNLLKVDAAMQEIRASLPPEAITVNVHIVEGDTIRDIDDRPPPETPPPPPSPAPPPTETTTPSSPAPSAPAANFNVVPIRRDGSVHDVTFASGEVAPLKRYQNEPWRGHVQPNLGGGYANGSPFSAGPMPNFSALPLPSPYDRGRS